MSSAEPGLWSGVARRIWAWTRSNPAAVVVAQLIRVTAERRRALFCHSCRPGVLESQRDQLLDAIHEHAKAVERQVSKGHWSRANAALDRARLEVLRQLGID